MSCAPQDPPGRTLPRARVPHPRRRCGASPNRACACARPGGARPHAVSSFERSAARVRAGVAAGRLAARVPSELLRTETDAVLASLRGLRTAVGRGGVRLLEARAVTIRPCDALGARPGARAARPARRRSARCSRRCAGARAARSAAVRRRLAGRSATDRGAEAGRLAARRGAAARRRRAFARAFTAARGDRRAAARNQRRHRGGREQPRKARQAKEHARGVAPGKVGATVFVCLRGRGW